MRDGLLWAARVSSFPAAAAIGFAFVGVLACGGTEHVEVVSARSTERQPSAAPSEDPFAPPDDARRLCGGHVTTAPGADGEAAAHIVWQAYASPQAPNELSDRYSLQLSPPEPSSQRDCVAWRHPAEQPRRVLEICTTDAFGPWTDCPAPPAGTASILLVSSRSSPDR